MYFADTLTFLFNILCDTWWVSFAPVLLRCCLIWCLNTLFLSSPRLSVIIGFIYDLFVARYGSFINELEDPYVDGTNI